MSESRISISSKILLVTAALCLIGSLFVPIWRIELDAPQYPEGLALTIHADKLAGDVEIINGLNHYIGMATLHEENFIEFTVLPYLIGFFALWTLLAAIVGRKMFLKILLIGFILFGIVAMVDFWRWEYNYGHNLDPKAAIIVPGMSYQPPLIGFKQLLNFGAYSIPDKGGWLFIASGLLMVLSVFVDSAFYSRWRRPKLQHVGGIIVLLFLASCGASGPEAIRLNSDGCAFCKMTIADGRFGAEVVTSKGRIYKYDDISCLLRHAAENDAIGSGDFFVNDYSKDNVLISTQQAYYVISDSLHSPMRGNIAAFSSTEVAQSLADSLKTNVVEWKLIRQH